MAAGFGGVLGTTTNDPNPGGTSFNISASAVPAGTGANLVVVEICSFGVTTAATFTVTGGGLTWTTNVRALTGGAWGESAATAPAPSGMAASTLTVTCSQTTTFIMGSAYYLTDTGSVDFALGATNQTISASPNFFWQTSSITPTAAGIVTGQAVRSQAQQAGTARTNYTEINDYNESNSNSSHHSVYRAGVAASTAYTDIGGAWTSATPGNYWAVGLNVRDAAVAAEVPPPNVLMAPYQGAY